MLVEGWNIGNRTKLFNLFDTSELIESFNKLVILSLLIFKLLSLKNDKLLISIVSDSVKSEQPHFILYALNNEFNIQFFGESKLDIIKFFMHKWFKSKIN